MIYGPSCFIQYAKECFGIKAILKFLLFNYTSIEGHLWYLSALIYVLVLAFLLDKYKSRRILYPIIPILILCDLSFGKYSLLIWGREFPLMCIRNWLFVGIPYFFLGDMLKTSRKREMMYKK